MREREKTSAARQLRRAMTPAEQRLWFYLRRRQLGGCRFRRQHPIGSFVVDFACIERCCVVEVDGSQHLDSERDQAREAWLRRQGFRVLRYWNHDVLERTEQVLAAILEALGESAPIRPWAPSPVERGKTHAGSPTTNPSPACGGRCPKGGWGHALA
jgi:very-short-patch-repair endonuclease